MGKCCCTAQCLLLNPDASHQLFGLWSDFFFFFGNGLYSGCMFDYCKQKAQYIGPNEDNLSSQILSPKDRNPRKSLL
jgi:hypothetical protein